MPNEITTCPHCHADLRGEPIPLDQREAYGGHEYFLRVIGIYDQILDCTTHWQCPDCGRLWRREETECYFSTGIDESPTCSDQPDFDDNGFPEHDCPRFPCAKFNRIQLACEKLDKKGLING